MNRAKQIYQRFGLVILSLLLAAPPACAAAAPATAAPAEVVIDTAFGRPIALTVNKLAKLKSPRKIQRAHVVNPAIAELVYSPSQSPQWVFVSGKTVGTTQLTLWDERNEMAGTFEITVSPDTTELKKGLFEIFPGENVAVRTSGEYITLTGTVSSVEVLSKVLQFAQTFSPGTESPGGGEGPAAAMPAAGKGASSPAKIINLLQVGGVQQVMLEVRIAEISKSVGQQLGVNFAWSGANAFGLSLLDNLTAIPKEGWPGNPLTISNSINSVLGFISGDTVIVSVDALQEDGLLQILAKPTLIAQSGQNASFLAGGEFPFPVASAFDRFAIEWKPFGVSLNFTPTVLGNDTISMVVSPEVSELDFTKTISYAGYVVPSINTRRTSTVVELKDKQSFAIAGLLKNYVRESVKKFPLLGDIPILGALFRSSRFQKEETELLVIVTPHLVKPVDAGTLPLPTDSYEDPTPFEFMMLGMMEKWHPPQRQGQVSGKEGKRPRLEGDFGYIIPE
jgi:pilus assembly protein CpaC